MNARQFRRWRVRHHHSAKIDIALHRVARIDLHAAAATNDRDTPAVGENGQVIPEIHVREQFHDYVNTASAGCVHDLHKMVSRAMIEHFVRALFTRELASVFSARGAKYAQTAGT